jgi:hypothetical protein
VFLKTYEEFLTEPADRERLAAMVARRTVDLDAALEDLAAGLTPEARLIYDLFERATPDEVPALLAQMHEGMRERMAGLSPARRDFTTLRARLYLAHDRNDTTIPFVESLHIADLARGRVRTRLVVLEILHHVDPKPWRTQPWEFLTRDVPEAVRLGGWWCALLEERGR